MFLSHYMMELLTLWNWFMRNKTKVRKLSKCWAAVMGIVLFIQLCIVWNITKMLLCRIYWWAEISPELSILHQHQDNSCYCCVLVFSLRTRIQHKSRQCHYTESSRVKTSFSVFSKKSNDDDDEKIRNTQTNW